ncbi:MAG: hypothetical protein O9256_00190 [Rhizobiaceae bacterium]|nr:hypothetical protein [Rhizobiaceae bacterium]MCZ8351198.1 hypothetical protein [Rhizobium sp.]
MRDICLNPMFRQIASKFEELLNGAAPGTITGSTTVRAATGLIAGIGLNNVAFADEDAWSLLDEVQKRTVVHFRPVSKYAAWLERDLADKRLREEAETEQQRSFRRRMEWQNEMTYSLEIGLKAPLAEALAVLALRSSVGALRAFAGDHEEACRMAWALQELGSALGDMGLNP